MKMRSLLLAAAALAAATPAFAMCARYDDGSPIQHWEKFHEDMRQDLYKRGFNIPAFGEAYFARMLADSELCEQDAISFREYSARVAEGEARMLAEGEAREAEEYRRFNPPPDVLPPWSYRR